MRGRLRGCEMRKIEFIAKKYVKLSNEFLSLEAKGNLGQINKMDIPTKPGIYLFTDKNEKILYVGKTKNIQDRLYSKHRMGTLESSTLKRKLVKLKGLKQEEVKKYMESKFYVRWKIIPLAEITSFEHFLISVLNPEYND